MTQAFFVREDSAAPGSSSIQTPKPSNVLRAHKSDTHPKSCNHTSQKLQPDPSNSARHPRNRPQTTMNSSPRKPTTTAYQSNIRMNSIPNLSLSSTNRSMVMDSWFSPTQSTTITTSPLPPPRDITRIAPTFGRPSSDRHPGALGSSRTKVEQEGEGSYFASKATLQALQSACEIAEEVMQLLGLEDSDEEEGEELESRDFGKKVVDAAQQRQ